MNKRITEFKQKLQDKLNQEGYNAVVNLFPHPLTQMCNGRFDNFYVVEINSTVGVQHFEIYSKGKAETFYYDLFNQNLVRPKEKVVN